MSFCFKASKFLLYLVPLMVVIVTPSTLFPYIVGKFIWFRITVDLSLIFLLLGLFLNRNGANEILIRLKNLYKKPLVIAVSIFIFIFLLAGFFGINPKLSFWSNFERGEGGFELLHFYIFFGLSLLLFKTEKDWHKMLTMLIVSAALMIFYGFASDLKFIDFKATTETLPNGMMLSRQQGENGPFYNFFHGFFGPAPEARGHRFFGSIGNSDSAATYLIFALFYSVYFLNSKYRGRPFSFAKLCLWFSLGLFFWAFIAAGTRGAFLGLVAAVLAFLFYIGWRSQRWRKRLVIAAAVFVLALFVLIQFRNAPFIKSSPLSRVINISFSVSSFKDRLSMWKIAIDGFISRPLLGWGPENFSVVFERRFDIKHYSPAQAFGDWFDRAHSVYFDYLAETGILGLLSYLGIFGAFYWQFFRRKSLVISRQSLVGNALLFALPIAYLVQGIAFFDVSTTYLNVFFFLALASYFLNKNG